MSRVCIVTDPIAERASVQYEVLKTLIKGLKNFDNIIILSPFIGDKQKYELEGRGNIDIKVISSKRKLYYSILNKFRYNESMLWAVSWLMESLFYINSRESNIVGQKNSEVVNTSYTVPTGCKVYWNQATPPVVTLKQMAKSNLLALFMSIFFGKLFSLLDKRVMSNHKKYSQKIAHNSKYLMDLYSKLGLVSDIVIHSPKEFTELPPTKIIPSKDYVLAYIGKEVNVDTVLKIARLGIRIKSFGAKIPYGVSLSQLREKAGFLGYVDSAELSRLYDNALITIFPFTEEPFGWVPLESMQHGTPVLSYDKQGPSETIVDGVTGWLVDTEAEFIAKALSIWGDKSTGLSPRDCMDRVKAFSYEETGKKIVSLLEESDDS